MPYIRASWWSRIPMAEIRASVFGCAIPDRIRSGFPRAVLPGAS
ncbi:DUF1156 domain-containing protein [Rhizobium leguminosarum]|nr:DUF1156 domain-containing protein [Rhizobium leguminosarum]